MLQETGFFFAGNFFVLQIKFDCSLFMVSAIRAQLPTPWQYNLKNHKSQDMLGRKFEIYPEIRKIDQPVWGMERKKKQKQGELCAPQYK